MQYNYKVSFYNDEVQITRYSYNIYFTDDDMKGGFDFENFKNDFVDNKQSFVNNKKSVADFKEGNEIIDSDVESKIYDLISDCPFVLHDFIYTDSGIDYNVHCENDSVSISLVPKEDDIVNNELYNRILNQKRSERRSKQSIYEISRANQWDYFVTFTFENNRYDYDSCKIRLQEFLKHFKLRKLPNMEWLVVPEQHKDGAWHFHGLIQGDLSDYLFDKFGNNKSWKGYNYGISEVESVRDSNRVASYITKYITKELTTTLKNRRRYFCSKGVSRPDHRHFLVENDNIWDFIQGNFPDYYVSHAKTIRYNDNPIDYIQLKKE